MESLGSEELFFDPFAENAETFDVQASFETILQRYQNEEVEHDYTADKFVADTKTLMLDAQFVGQFDALEAIAVRMHELCQDDHLLQTAMGEQGDAAYAHEAHGQGHDHGDHAHAAAGNHGDDNKSAAKYETKNSKKKKKLPEGWLAILAKYWQRYSSRSSKPKQ